MIQTKETEVTVQKYPAYKESGVDWLGEIPEGWQILPGLRFIIEGKEKNKGMIRDTVLSLSYGNIRVREKEELTGLVPESFETYQLVNKGDLIFRPTDLQNDKVSLRSSISNYVGIITSAYLNLRIKDNASSKYYHYLFRAIDNNKVIYGLGSGLRQNISYLDFRRFNFPFPPLPEQTAIANFLDDKTTKIDTAIAQKEKMIALPKERKQIMIQNAVTKGLDPNVQMKDSGVEWIGEIPEGWEVKRVKQCAHIISKGTTPSTEGRLIIDEGTVRFIKAENIQNGTIIDYPCHFIDEKTNNIIGRSKLQNGDILFVIAGATLGKVALIEDRHLPANTNQAVSFIRPNSTVDGSYLSLWLTSGYIVILTWLEAVQSAQPNLSMEALGNFPFISPPLYEQNLILHFINDESTKIDQSITLQQTQIAKLKEYKATLIDSAVTGKIKVS